MRENPDLDQLKRQARELLDAYRASSPEAVVQVEVCSRVRRLDGHAGGAGSTW
jgi:hypothetical protein